MRMIGEILRGPGVKKARHHLREIRNDATEATVGTAGIIWRGTKRAAGELVVGSVADYGLFRFIDAQYHDAVLATLVGTLGEAVVAGGAIGIAAYYLIKGLFHGTRHGAGFFAKSAATGAELEVAAMQETWHRGKKAVSWARETRRNRGKKGEEATKE